MPRRTENMKQEKTIKYLGFTIKCLLLSEDEKAPVIYGIPFREGSAGGVVKGDDNSFTVWFSDIPTMDALVHETYHLFCYIMEVMNGDNCFTWNELNAEIYAYNFHALYDEISDTFISMPLYKKIYNMKKALN